MGYMQNVAPKDGTVDRAHRSAAVAFDPLTVAESHFDARQFGWLGSANGETNVCMVWHTSPIRTLDDLFTKRDGGRHQRAQPAPTPSIPT